MLTELDQPWAAALVLDAFATRWIPARDGDNRTAAFHRQLAAIDPGEAWARLRAPLYIAATSPTGDEPDRIAARAAGPTTIARIASRTAFADLGLAWLTTIMRA
ncbi:MAG: hypothetical protein KIT31_03435 [Deltaproteobacteria bacterium]|nr:hypothetical protein [Deltaproteobacteria bacterium]